MEYPKTFSLRFSPDIAANTSDSILLKVSPQMISKLSNDSSVVIKGRSEDECTVCFFDETYSMKSSQTSNTLLVSENMSGNGTTSKCILMKKNGVIELERIIPEMSRMFLHLKKHAYKGTENLVGFSLNELSMISRCCEIEAKIFLRSIGALEVDAQICLLDPKYEFDALIAILHQIDILYGNTTNIDIFELIQSLPNLPEFVVSHICEQLVDDHQQNQNTNKSGAFNMDRLKIAKMVGTGLLVTLKRMLFTDFMCAWKKLCPKNEYVSIQMLLGCCRFTKILPSADTSNEIVYICPQSLSSILIPRLESLFRLSCTWNEEHLHKFLLNFTSDKDKSTLTTWLNRNVVTTDSTRGFQYSAKKGFLL